MMATVATLVTNLIANTSKFSAPMKKAQKDVSALEAQLKKLQSVGKIGLSFLTAEKLKSFIGNALKDATTEGSKLNMLLGKDMVESAAQLKNSLEDVKAQLQQIAIITLQKTKPAIDAMALGIEFAANEIADPQSAAKRTFVNASGDITALKTQEELRARYQQNVQRLGSVTQRAASSAKASFFSPVSGTLDVQRAKIQAESLQAENRFLIERIRLLNENPNALDQPGNPNNPLSRGITSVFDTLRSGIKLTNDRFSMLGDKVGSLSDRFKQLTEDSLAVADLYKQTRTPLEEFNTQMQELRRLLGTGLLDRDTFNRRRQQLLEQDPLFDRVQSLQSQEFARPELAVKGSQEFLKAIHTDSKEEKKDIKQLVRIAQQELEQERRQAREIADEIARQRVTVNMP